MKKHMFKILICTIVLLMAVGAASAIDANSTDDVASVDSQPADDVLSVDDTEVDVASTDDGAEPVSACDDEKALNAKVTDTGKLSSNESSSADTIKTTTQYKTLVLGKMKIPKKYKKLDSMNKNSKKYKKLNKKFKKLVKKQSKKLSKSTKKKLKAAKKNHWYTYGKVFYTSKITAKKYIFTYKVNALRTYKYNTATNAGWWVKY